MFIFSIWVPELRWCGFFSIYLDIWFLWIGFCVLQYADHVAIFLDLSINIHIFYFADSLYFNFSFSIVCYQKVELPNSVY